MYRFTTKDGQPTRVDPTAVRAIIPVGNYTGLCKLVLDGGHAVTVQGETEVLHELLNQYRLHHATPSEAASQSELAKAHAELSEANEELRAARAQANRVARMGQMRSGDTTGLNVPLSSGRFKDNHQG